MFFDYAIQIFSKTQGRFNYMLESKKNYESLENWREKLSHLKLKEKEMDYRIERVSLNLPTKSEASPMIREINNLLDRYQIRSSDISYLDYEQKGKYTYLPIELKFKARYLEGIHFLNDLERNKILMIIENLEIDNAKNKRNSPISFKAIINLLLLN